MAGEDLSEARSVREIISWHPSLGKWRSGPGYSAVLTALRRALRKARKSPVEQVQEAVPQRLCGWAAAPIKRWPQLYAVPMRQLRRCARSFTGPEPVAADWPL